MLASAGPSRVFVIATPIGNLEDITLRALRALKEADILLCEDTRVTRKLLSHHGIDSKMMFPLKEFNEFQIEHSLRISHGKTVAIVSDSGTPTVSDPGAPFISRVTCPVLAIPGASSVTASLSVSGMGRDGFVFLGFLHKANRKIKKELAESLALEKAVVFFESPYRILKTLQILAEIAPQARCVLCREMTKIHEEVLRGNPQDLSKILQAREKILGEITVVVEK